MTFTQILSTQKLTDKIGCLVLIATRHDNRPAIKPNIFKSLCCKLSAHGCKRARF